MKLTSRVLLGTLAMAAAVSGSAASAYADTAGTAGTAGTASGSGNGSAGGSADDPTSSATDALLCPFVTSGPIHAVLNDLNPQSAAEACAGPSTNLVTGNKATANQPAAAAAAAASGH